MSGRKNENFGYRDFDFGYRDLGIMGFYISYRGVKRPLILVVAVDHY